MGACPRPPSEACVPVILGIWLTAWPDSASPVKLCKSRKVRMLLFHTTLGNNVKLTTDLIMRWCNIPNFSSLECLYH